MSKRSHRQELLSFEVLTLVKLNFFFFSCVNISFQKATATSSSRRPLRYLSAPKWPQPYLSQPRILLVGFPLQIGAQCRCCCWGGCTTSCLAKTSRAEEENGENSTMFLVEYDKKHEGAKQGVQSGGRELLGVSNFRNWVKEPCPTHYIVLIPFCWGL